MTATTGNSPEQAREAAFAPEALSAFDSTADRESSGYYDELRSRGPIVRDEAGCWVVTSHELLRQVALEDQVVWQSAQVYNPERPTFGLTREEWLGIVGPAEQAIGLREGPDYDRMHRWYFRALSPKVLQRWGDALIEPIVNAQIDRFVDAGSFDVYDDLTDRVTPRVMTAVLGLPFDDEEWFTQFMELHLGGTAGLFTYSRAHRPPQEVIDQALRAVVELQEMLRPHVEARRSGEGDDLISLIWAGAQEMWPEEEWDADAIVTTATNAFSAGAGTTASTAGSAIYLLATRPGLEERVRAGGTTEVRNLAEEGLRLYGNIEWTIRYAKRDTELGGVLVKEGEMVILATASANRDPARYPQPSDVVIDRSAPRDHFAFWAGPRTCPGQSLARYTLERILAVVIDRLRDLQLDPAAESPQWRGNVLRRWEPLRVRFTAAS
jgi:cytochrome P450